MGIYFLYNNIITLINLGSLTSIYEDNMKKDTKKTSATKKASPKKK